MTPSPVPPPTSKRLAILQSSYVPWKGYFDIIASVDEFVLYDTAQYTKNDWRNRNCIRTPGGTTWLTIPVATSGRFGCAIQEMEVSDPRWSSRHWRSLQTYYARAPHFDALAGPIRTLYERVAEEPLLSRINETFLRGLCVVLGIDTTIRRSSEFELRGDRTERLVHICTQAGADHYLTGPAARSYLDEAKFAAYGVTVGWMDYAGYAAYEQLHAPPFVHEVSVLDLLFNVGAAAAKEHLVNAATRRRS